jgi:hypothetical protein
MSQIIAPTPGWRRASTHRRTATPSVAAGAIGGGRALRLDLL